MSRTVSCTVHTATGTPSGQSAPDRGMRLRHPNSPHSPVLSVARPVFVRIMSLPVPTNPTEFSALRRRARRLVDTMSDLITHGQHTYAAFQARVDADRPAKDNGWDHFVDLYLWQVLVPPPPFNAPDILAQLAAGTAPFGVHLLNRLLRNLQEHFGQLQDVQLGRPPVGPAAGWQGLASPGAHLFPMPAPPGPLLVPFPPFGAHHHQHHHHLFHDPKGHPAVPGGGQEKNRPGRRNFNPVGGGQGSRLKKKTPKVEKFPVGWGVFGDQNFNPAEGGDKCRGLKKNTQS